MAINNPYVPGDPYSYDLKWIVRHLKEIDTILSTLDETIVEKIKQLLDQHDPIYWKSAADLISSDMKTPSLAYIQGYYEPGDGGANLYYVTSDYNDVLAADFYLTLDGANRWAIPVICTPYVTPEMFGAKGDNSEDAKDAINTAIKYALPVYFKPGAIYMIQDGDIVPVSGTIFIGNKCLLKLHSEETNSHIIKASGISDVLIEDMFFDGASASGSTYASAIQLSNVRNVVIRDVTISNFTNNSVQFTYSDNCELSNMEAHDVGLTMAYNSSRVRFSNIRIWDCSFGYVLQLKSCQDSVIENSHVEMADANEFGIMVSYGNAETDPEANSNNKIVNCTVRYDGSGTQQEAYRTNGPSDSIVYENCTADGAAFHISQCENCVIVNCTAINSITSAIRLNGTEQTLIEGNMISASKQNGIHLADGNKKVMITGNEIIHCNTSNNSNYRQIVVGSATEEDVYIVNNVIRRNDATTYLISFSGTPGKIFVMNNIAQGGEAIMNGAIDKSTSRIIGNGYGVYRQTTAALNITGIVEIENGRSTVKQAYDSAPAGTWSAGDICFKKTPTAAIPLGWSHDGSNWNVI